jgi:hypothetical protein
LRGLGFLRAWVLRGLGSGGSGVLRDLGSCGSGFLRGLGAAQAGFGGRKGLSDQGVVCGSRAVWAVLTAVAVHVDLVGSEVPDRQGDWTASTVGRSRASARRPARNRWAGCVVVLSGV